MLELRIGCIFNVLNESAERFSFLPDEPEGVGYLITEGLFRPGRCGNGCLGGWDTKGFRPDDVFVCWLLFDMLADFLFRGPRESSQRTTFFCFVIFQAILHAKSARVLLANYLTTMSVTYIFFNFNSNFFPYDISQPKFFIFVPFSQRMISTIFSTIHNFYYIIEQHFLNISQTLIIK